MCESGEGAVFHVSDFVLTEIPVRRNQRREGQIRMHNGHPAPLIPDHSHESRGAREGETGERERQSIGRESRLLPGLVQLTCGRIQKRVIIERRGTRHFAGSIVMPREIAPRRTGQGTRGLTHAGFVQTDSCTAYTHTRFACDGMF